MTNYKILINSKGVPVLVEVPEKPRRSLGTYDFIYPSLKLEYEQALSTALADESKHIAFKDEARVIDLLSRKELCSPLIVRTVGQTFDLPENIGVSFDWSPCENDICLCGYFEKSDCGYTRKLAILTTKSGKSAHSFTEGIQVPESVPSCGEQEDNWINVKDRLPEAEKWVWIYHAKGFQTKGYFVLQNEFGLLWKISGSELRSYGCVSHWQPLPKAPTKH